METSLQAGKWPSIVSRLGEMVDLEATARSFGALQRVREVRRAEDLPRLALMYGPGHWSLRTTAAMAADAAIAERVDPTQIQAGPVRCVAGPRMEPRPILP